MESYNLDQNNSNNEYRNSQSEIKKLKKRQTILFIICIILLLLSCYLAFIRVPQVKTQFIEVQTKNNEVEKELEALIAEHEKIKQEYGDLSEQLSEKDSVILANAEEIKKLIASQADYRKIKKKMERLQNISREYVAEMDRLYQENQILKEENTKVKGDLAKVKEERNQITEEKEVLHSKMQSAAVLKAYSLMAKGTRQKSKGVENTNKASRVENIRFSFVIGENSLIEAGPVNLYCRIAIPESKRVLTPNNSDLYSFTYNDSKLQYSIKKTIQYEGKAQSITMNWAIPSSDKVVKGVYTIALYTDNQYLGETTMELQ